MGGPVTLPGWVLSIPASLALHAVPLVLLLRLFTPSVPDIFVIDLSESPEVARVQPPPTEPAKRPSGPPAHLTKSPPSPPRAEPPAPPSARVEPPVVTAPVSPPPPLATLTPEQPQRVPEPPPAQPPITPTPPAPVAEPAPMPQVAEPPRPSAPAVEAIFASPTAARAERDAPAPAAAPMPVTTTRAAVSGPSEAAAPAAPTATARVAPGAPGGGAGDGNEAEYRAYLGLVRQRILEALRYPLAARQQGLVGTVYIEIVVQPTGAISAVRIISPSSHPILDQAALETVRSLPSIGFPPGLAPRQLRARLPVMFNLR